MLEILALPAAGVILVSSAPTGTVPGFGDPPEPRVVSSATAATTEALSGASLLANRAAHRRHLNIAGRPTGHVFPPGRAGWWENVRSRHVLPSVAST